MSKVKQSKSNRIKNDRTFMIVSAVCLFIYSAILLYMLGFILMTSFKSVVEFSINKTGLPKTFSINPYVSLLDLNVPVGTTKIYLEEMLYYSIRYMIIYTICPMTAQVCVAYACAKYKCAYTKFLYDVVIFFLVVPVIGGLSSSLEIAMKLGTYDNIWGSMFFQFNFGGGTFLILYGVFKGIPRDYMEAAQMDGAGHFYIMTRIMLPMGMGVIGVFLITTLIGAWNDYSTALIWFPSSPTFAYGLYRLSTAGSGNTAAGVPVQCATCVAAAIPSIIAFACFKDKVIGTMYIGGLKG